MSNGRCRVHGGKESGAPKANQNARKHGIFAKSLGPAGLEAYNAAKEVEPDELARDSAEFLVAQVAQAYEYSHEFEDAKGLFRKFLDTEIAEQKLDPEIAFRMMNRLNQPSLDTLGRALGPLKSLLEVKKPLATDEADDPILEMVKDLKEMRKSRE